MGTSSEPPDPMTVLHVDGYPPFAELSARLLERASPSLTVTTARTAGDAMAAVRAGDVDCVVSGYDLPGTDGLALLESVRSATPWLPFVLFTGCREPGLRREALRRGAAAVLLKETDPAQFATLADRVVALVSRTRARRAGVSTAATSRSGDSRS